jgi:hypothetical protein
MRSSVATMYTLGFFFQAGCDTAPDRASTPQGTCASAMKAAAVGLWNFVSSTRPTMPTLSIRRIVMSPSIGQQFSTI